MRPGAQVADRIQSISRPVRAFVRGHRHTRKGLDGLQEVVGLLLFAEVLGEPVVAGLVGDHGFVRRDFKKVDLRENSLSNSTSGSSSSSFGSGSCSRAFTSRCSFCARTPCWFWSSMSSMPLLQIVIGSSDPDPALVAVMAQALAWTSNQSSIGSPSAWTSNPHSKRSSWPSVVNGRSNGEDGSSSHARHTHFHRALRWQHFWQLRWRLPLFASMCAGCSHSCCIARIMMSVQHLCRGPGTTTMISSASPAAASGKGTAVCASRPSKLTRSPLATLGAIAEAAAAHTDCFHPECCSWLSTA